MKKQQTSSSTRLKRMLAFVLGVTVVVPVCVWAAVWLVNSLFENAFLSALVALSALIALLASLSECSELIRESIDSFLMKSPGGGYYHTEMHTPCKNKASGQSRKVLVYHEGLFAVGRWCYDRNHWVFETNFEGKHALFWCELPHRPPGEEFKYYTTLHSWGP